MSFLAWMTNAFSHRGGAMADYKRGMAQAKKGDQQGAIEAYTATIEAANTPDDLRAMALYNRALVYAASKENAKAIDDLNVVLAIPEAPADVKTEAKRKLARIDRRASGAKKP